MARLIPQGWEPSKSKEEVGKLSYNYAINPTAYDDRQDELNDLELHTSYYQMPFARSQAHQDNIIFATAKQFGKGLVDGFTVVSGFLPDENTPRNTTESIARNLGELVGFIGYVPGAVARAVPLIGRLAGKSVPLQAGKFVKDKLANVANKKIRDAQKDSWITSSGTIADIASGAVTMGVASGVSSISDTEGDVEDYLKRILTSTAYGTAIGTAARSISGLKYFGTRIRPDQVDKVTGNPIFSKLEQGQKADLALRTFANSIMDGAPASISNQTTADQVYSYLIGAILGWNDLPLRTRTSIEHFQKSVRDKTGESPEMHPDWDNYTVDMQESIKRDWKFFLGDDESMHAIRYGTIAGRNIDLEEIQKYAESKGVELGFDPATGEVFDTGLGDINKQDIRKAQEELNKYGITQDLDDLDMHMEKIEDLSKNGQPLINFVTDSGIAYKNDSERILIASDIFSKWKTLQEEDSVGIMRPVADAEMQIAKYINNKYRIIQSQSSKDWWRNFSEQLRKKERLAQYSIVADGSKIDTYFLGSNINEAGNKKNVEFEPPLIEYIYRDLVGTETEPSQFYTFLDHVIYKNREYDLLRTRSQIEKEISTAEKAKPRGDRLSKEEIKREAMKRYVDIMSKAHKDLSQQDYFYAGGKGDNKRMYFIKKHPYLKDSGITRIIRNFQRKLVEKGYFKSVGDVMEMMRDNAGDYRKRMYNGKDFMDLYKKTLVNNILYDISNNGFRLDNTSNEAFFKSLNEGLDKVMSKGFLPNAKAYNKRAQIWFNTGLTADEAFVSKKLNLDRNYFIYKILDDSKLGATGKASQQAESTDGVIYTLPEVVDALNADKGLPIEGAFNKSFIVSNADGNGALLGKYALQIPSKKLEKQMRSEGIEMLMPKSSVKQMGLRKFNQPYFLPIKDIKTILSEKTSKKYIKPQKLPKQMFSTLSMYGYKDTSQEVYDAMYEDLLGRGKNGTEESQMLITKYRNKPSNELADSIVENLDTVSLKEIFSIINNPKEEALASKIVSKILKTNDENYRELAEEGELAREDLLIEREVGIEFDSLIDRIMKLYPEGSSGAFMHKMIRPYRETSFRNYIVRRLTRPELSNSGITRMRAYDPGMKDDPILGMLEQGTHNLKQYKTVKNIKNDRLFFLDDGFKDMLIHSEFFPKPMKLGDLWNRLSDENNREFDGVREEVEELLRAVVMRVPMDSTSGANVLYFGGFTGLRGYGSVTHPKVMRALGGADLDGDKAFVFFGGKNAMNKEYKDLYDAQRDEFMDNGREMHNKDEKDLIYKNKKLRELFALSKGEIGDRAENKLSYYDPYWRNFMSSGATEGRGVLGYAVTRRASIIGAYNSIRAMGDNRVFFNVTHPNTGQNSRASIGKGAWRFEYDYFGKDKVLEMSIKTKPDALKAFRMRARTAIAIGSDPMDEAGVRSLEHFDKMLLEPLFNIKVFTKENGTLKYDKKATDKIIDGEDTFTLSYGLPNLYSKINSVLYSKNSFEGERYTYSDIISALDVLSDMPAIAKNNLLPRLGEAVLDINFDMNVFQRVDQGYLRDLYDQMNLEITDDKDYLKNVLQRKAIFGSQSNFIKAVYDTGIHNLSTRKNISMDEGRMQAIINSKMLFNGFDGLPSKFRYSRGDRSRMNVAWNRRLLDHILYKAEDFFVNDVSDFATAKRILDIVKNNNILDSKVDEIFKQADLLKNNGVQRARQRNERNLYGDLFEPVASSASTMYKPSAVADNIILDKKARDYKKTLNSAEKELFDAFLLGSFQRGNVKALRKLQEKLKNTKRPQDRNRIEESIRLLKKQSVNTATVRYGYNSEEVSNSNVKKQLDVYDKIYRKTIDQVPEEDIATIKETIGGEGKVTSLVDGEGNRIEGSIIEESDLSAKLRKFLNEIEPFIGIEKGFEIKDSELREAFYDIKRHLDNMHNADAIQINQLFRTVVGKNINSGNKQDFLTFKRYLDDLNTPVFWRRMWDYLKGKTPDEIKRIYYFRFPESIDKELMTNPGFRQLRESVSPYVDRLGNTISGKALTPMSPMGEIQQYSARATEISMRIAEEEKSKMRDALEPYLNKDNDGDILYDIAVAKRELELYTKEVNRDKNTIDPTEVGSKLMYKEEWDKVKDDYNKKYRDKKYRVSIGNKRVDMTGKEIIDAINKQITKDNINYYPYLVGDYKERNKWLSIAREGGEEVTFKGLDKLRKEWNLYVAKLMKENKPLPIDKLGVEGIRDISIHVLASFVPKKQRIGSSGQKILKDIIKRIHREQENTTGRFAPEVYFPHRGGDKKIAQQKIEEAIKKINADSTMSLDDKKQALKKAVYSYKNLTGEFMHKDEIGNLYDSMNEIINDVATGKKLKSENILNRMQGTIGNQRSREAHVPGYSRTPEAYEAYVKDIIDSFYRQAMQVSNRTVIYEFGEQFYKRTKDAGLTNAWRNFFRLYAQQAMGYPTVIPDSVMNDPLMKIKGTPYKWFSDSQVKKRLDFIAKKLDVNRKILSEYAVDEETVDELTGVTYSQLNNFSAMEARYQLMSLLAHPKSAIANVYGGSIHTIASSGMQHFRNARNIKYLKENVNSEWRSMADVEKWLIKLGVTEEFLLYEAKLNKDLKSRAFSSASAFMRVPEKILRRDAFMAHYLKAREIFGNGIREYDHPYLIEMARRGVKATQFLYSAPYRPMWTNSSLGRIMSRFQLWSYNSVKFRTDVARQARIYGYMPGTNEYDMAVRLFTADAMMLALSSVFAYSLFETALPAPYNWLQDTADYFFGNDKERERAFFGSALGPAQLITPPSLRILPASFKWMFDENEKILSSYYFWALFPFGRLARDVIGPQGIMSNPAFAVEKLTGFPLYRASKLYKKALEED